MNFDITVWIYPTPFYRRKVGNFISDSHSRCISADRAPYVTLATEGVEWAN